MTLAFSQELNRQPTYFVEKILTGLEKNNFIDYKEHMQFRYDCCEQNNASHSWIDCTCEKQFTPKIHTIRADEKNKWKAGNKVHFVINNRTKNRYQFAPVVPCVSTQKIEIWHWTIGDYPPRVIIDGIILKKTEIRKLAQNDGFENVKAFFDYFNTSFEGKLIHWTNHKY